MAALTIPIILFATYWFIILGIALYPGDPEYEDDGYGNSSIVKPAPVFSRKQKIYIKLLWVCVVGISIYFWQPIMGFLPTIGESTILVLVYGIEACFASGCFMIIVIPLWLLFWWCGNIFIFFVLPPKIIQYVCIFLSAEPVLRPEM